MSEWKSLQLNQVIPQPAQDVFDQMQSFVDPATAALQPISTLLDTLKTLLASIPDSPIHALILSILDALKAFVTDLTKTGVYVLVDLPLLPENGRFFVEGVPEAQAAMNALIESVPNITPSKAPQTDGNQPPKTEKVLVGDQYIDAIVPQTIDPQKATGTRSRIKYFGQNIEGGMDGFATRFRASLVDFEDSRRPSFSENASVAGISIVMIAPSIGGILRAIKPLLEVFNIKELPRPSVESFQVLPVNEGTYKITLGTKDRYEDEEYNAIVARWKWDFSILDEQQVTFLVGRTVNQPGGFPLLGTPNIDSVAGQSIKETHYTDEDGVPIGLYLVQHVVGSKTTSVVDSYVIEGNTYYYRVATMFGPVTDLPNDLPLYIGTDGRLYTDNPDYDSTQKGQLSYKVLTNTVVVSKPTPQRSAALYNPDLGDYKVSTGTYPDWTQASFETLFLQRTNVLKVIKDIENMLKGALDGYQAATVAIIDFIDLIQEKIDELNAIIALISDLLAFIETLENIGGSAIFFSFPSGGMQAVADLLSDPNVPGRPNSAKSDMVASVTVVCQAPAGVIIDTFEAIAG